ncbi:unnamed protein product [Trifolium pratense]|uniref:Uncharacterized protein n=1 Tax=Trifolium pratense TaxID=57577 RepID=A0ACB0KCB0_TRIPR|nr:unnamed protein product [Trifolium pratense]
MKIAELKQVSSRPDVVEIRMFYIVLILCSAFNSVMQMLLHNFLFIFQVWDATGRSKVAGVFEILSEYCTCTKALVSKEKLFAGERMWQSPTLDLLILRKRIVKSKLRFENENQLSGEKSNRDMRRAPSFSGPLMLPNRASANSLSAPIKSSGGNFKL